MSTEVMDFLVRFISKHGLYAYEGSFNYYHQCPTIVVYYFFPTLEVSGTTTIIVDLARLQVLIDDSFDFILTNHFDIADPDQLSSFIGRLWAFIAKKALDFRKPWVLESLGF